MGSDAAPSRFAYYDRLSAAEQAAYRQSDAARLTGLEHLAGLEPLVIELEAAMRSEARRRVGELSRRLAREVLVRLGAPPVRVVVKKVRPSSETEELQGLYEDDEDGTPPVITVWSHTAVQRRPVAVRTFVRTLVHELCHHLDYTVLALEDSFHTHGFYGREAAISRALLPERAPAPPPPRAQLAFDWSAP